MSMVLSPMDFHHGEALLRVAGHYPTLAEVVYESVQNGLDASASNINLTVNHKNHTLVIEDNGDGTSQTKFEKALTSVCHTIKDADKLGQFGMGLIAPLGKCEKFTFTSTPKANPQAYLCWVFETESIRKQKKIQGIPVEPVSGVRFSREICKGGLPWRTQVKLINFTNDRILSRMTVASLRENILERFSTTMKRLGVTISVKIVSQDGNSEVDTIVASSFDGRRLPVVYLDDVDAGQTTFKVYIAKKTAKGRKGKVVVGEVAKDFRISFAQFAKYLSEFLDHNIINALTSGIFEGEILSQKARFDPTRRKFEANDALVGFCATIAGWFKNVGEEHLLQLQEEMQDDRYQRLGLRSMQFMEGLLDQKEFSYLKDVVKSFRIGTIGAHHALPKKTIGPQPVPSLSTQGGGRGEKKNDVCGNGREVPKADHPDHTPYTVGGPKGRQRMMVKGNSLGLQFLYGDMEGSNKLWDLDSVTGILHFNIRHPLWAQCETDEKVLMRFQEHIALTALMLETVPSDWKDRHRSMSDDGMPLFVFWLLKGDELAGRKPGAGLINYRHKQKAKKIS